MFRRSFFGSLIALFGLGSATAAAAPLATGCGDMRPAKRSRFFRFEAGGPAEGLTPFFIDLSEVAMFRVGENEDGTSRIGMRLKSGQHFVGVGTKERIGYAISMLLDQ